MNPELRDLDRRVAELTHETIKGNLKPFGFLDYVGLSAVALIVIGTGVVVTVAIQHDKKEAERPKPVIQLPHGYRYIDMPGSQTDVITFCDAGNRIYKDAGGTKGEAVAVIPNDPACAGS